MREEDSKSGWAEGIAMATGWPGRVGGLVSFDCTVVQTMRWDPHLVILFEVVDIERAGNDSLPLIYACRSYGSPSLLAQG